jgi:hypothetical protein
MVDKRRCDERESIEEINTIADAGIDIDTATVQPTDGEGEEIGILRSNDGTMPSRRKILKMAAGTGAGALTFPGLAAADDGSVGDHSAKTREEKAAEVGKEWNEDWIEEDKIGEDWGDLEIEVDDTTIGPADRGPRTVGDEFGIQGITVTVRARFENCRGEVTIGALGQSATRTLTCSGVCESIRLDGGAAYFDGRVCYNWNTHTLTIEGSGCIWHLTSWTCNSTTRSFS